MPLELASRWRRIFIELWVGATVVLLLLGAAASLRDPSLPIHIGLLDAPGLTAVFGTTLPAVCGIAALMGIFQQRASAPILLLLYSLFWLVTLVGGMFAAAWEVGAEGLARVTGHTWIVGGIMFLVMISCFLVLAVWAFRELAARSPETSRS